MKKIIQCIFLLFISLLFVSCSHQEQGYIIDPEPYDNGCHADSSGITAEIEGEVTTASETITILITGSNVPGKPYAVNYFSAPALEYRDGEEWKRIPIKDEGWMRDMECAPEYYWTTKYREGDELPAVMQDTAEIHTGTLTRPLRKGDYRTVLFFPDRTIYTEFTISE